MRDLKRILELRFENHSQREIARIRFVMYLMQQMLLVSIGTLLTI